LGSVQAAAGREGGQSVDERPAGDDRRRGVGDSAAFGHDLDSGAKDAERLLLVPDQVGVARVQQVRAENDVEVEVGGELTEKS
jgi:hypothetical protein